MHIPKNILNLYNVVLNHRLSEITSSSVYKLSEVYDGQSSLTDFHITYAKYNLTALINFF